jgi:hypothetical protein
MRKLSAVAIVPVLTLLTLFPSLALSQAAVAPAAAATATMPDPESNLADFAGAVYQAFAAKNWGVLIALVLVGLVFLARHFGSKAWPFLGTDRGGALLSLVGGLGLSVFAAATAAGTHTVLQVLGTGLLMTVTASGTYVLVKKLLFPSGADQVQALQAAQPAEQTAAAEAALAGEKSATDLLKDAAK